MGFCCGDFSGRHVEANNFRIHLAFADSSRYDLRVLRTEIEDENFRMLRRGVGLHALRMSLRNSVFAGGIAGLPLFGTKLPLPRHSALELAADFL